MQVSGECCKRGSSKAKALGQDPIGPLEHDKEARVAGGQRSGCRGGEVWERGPERVAEGWGPTGFLDSCRSLIVTSRELGACWGEEGPVCCCAEQPGGRLGQSGDQVLHQVQLDSVGHGDQTRAELCSGSILDTSCRSNWSFCQEVRSGV